MQSYEAKDIYVLEGLEPVRKRPGMYIGSTGVEGLHHLIWEVVDNSLDEAMAGYAKNIVIELLENNQVAVADDGRGIPIDIHHQTKKSALETVMCTLHAGGKFGGESYKISGGLHGVGVSVVNALSKWLKVEVCRNGNLYAQEYERGKPKFSVKKIGKCEKNGTKVIFEPDTEIFSKIEFNLKHILDHLRQQAFLTKGVKIEIIDQREKIPAYHSFYFEGGLISFINYLNHFKKPIQPNIYHAQKKYDDIEVEVAAVYDEELEIIELSFANNIYTPDGGAHLTGFRSALTRSLNDWARANNYLKDNEENLTGDDVREGMVAIVSVKLAEPQFEGQTKAKLGNPPARTAVEAVVNETLKEFLEKNYNDAKAIIEKCLLAQKARKAAKAAKETVLRKGVLEGLTLPGKLADCSSRNPEESELFVVEGDSAGGCFSGDTKIALTDGRNLSFKELVKENNQGKKNYCYTIKDEKYIGIEEIKNPRITKKSAEVIKIILDNNEEIICTPNHKFMLRSGNYKEAKDLTPNDSLMPLRRQYSKIGGKITVEGYEMVFESKTNHWIFTHLLADQYNIKNGIYTESAGTHKHHKDFNKLNNNPDNLFRMSKIAKKQWLDLELRKWRSEMTKKQWTEEFREKRKKAYNQTYLKKALEVLHDIYVKNKFISEEEYSQIRRFKNDKNLIKYNTICQRFFEGDESRLREAVINYNHRIKAIISLKERIDVYDIEVPETHNFALANGVFVHNSAKSGRDRHSQAILPLRGKILNVEKSRIDKMLANKEIRALVTAIGTAIGDTFNISKIRYHKIILMTDADVDGSHIRTLLLTLFYRYFLSLIESGYLYVAQPPLYRIQKGKEAKFVYSEQEKDKFLKSFGDDFSGINIQRYKGLGEMNPDQLWETTLNPQNRTLKQIAVEDAKEADELFDILMGEVVEPRKAFIQSQAAMVKNLDI